MSKVFAQMLMFSGIMGACFSASAILEKSPKLVSTASYDALIQAREGEAFMNDASFRNVIMATCVSGDPESYNFPCREALAKVMNNPHAVVSNGLQFFNWTCYDLAQVFANQEGLTDKNIGNINRLLVGETEASAVGAAHPGICSLQSRE